MFIFGSGELGSGFLLGTLHPLLGRQASLSDQAFRRIGWLGSDTKPMVDAIHFQFELLGTSVSLGIVGTKNLDEPTIAADRGRSNYHAVKRSMASTMSLQTNLDHNGLRK